MNYISAVTVARIKEWRAKWTGGQWLAAELKLALKDLGPLLDEGRVQWQELPGVRPSVLLEPQERHHLDPFPGVEGYSLRMMAAGLANPGAQFLSRTLAPEILASRKRIIEELRALYERLADDPGTAGQANADVATEPVASPEEPAIPSPVDGGDLAESEASPVERIEVDEPQVESVTPEPSTPTVAEAPSEPDSPERSGFSGPLADRLRGATPAAPKTEQGGDIAGIAPIDEAVNSPTPTTPSAEPAAAAVRQPAALEPEIAASLKDWAGQGREGSRLFKDLKRKGRFETLLERWGENPDLSAEDIQYRVILAFLGNLREVQINGHRLVIEIPKPPKMGVEEFERMLAEGMILGANGVDPRVWGLVRSTFKFLRNYLGSRLPT